MENKYRLIEYDGEIFIVVGIGTRGTQQGPKPYYVEDVFICVPLAGQKSIAQAVLAINHITIPIEQAKEITERERLEMIMVLYG